MSSRIAALERPFIRELTEIRFKPVLAEIADRWDEWDAEAVWPADPVMKSLDLLEEAGLCIQAHAPLSDFLARMARNGKKPTPRQMLNHLMLG